MEVAWFLVYQATLTMHNITGSVAQGLQMHGVWFLYLTFVIIQNEVGEIGSLVSNIEHLIFFNRFSQLKCPPEPA